jgi:hypothetical protein
MPIENILHKAVWYILWSFGNLVILTPFGILSHEKPGNPVFMSSHVVPYYSNNIHFLNIFFEPMSLFLFFKAQTICIT